MDCLLRNTCYDKIFSTHRHHKTPVPKSGKGKTDDFICILTELALAMTVTKGGDSKDEGPHYENYSYKSLMDQRRDTAGVYI